MDDLMAELGALALASRLKRIADCLMQDGARVYAAAGENFEPRWFPVFIYLFRRGPTSITALARGLGVSHPGINKVANELIEARLVAAYRDRNDKRKRVLALTSQGRAMQQALEPVWRDIRQALQSIIDEGGSDFLGTLGAVESSLSTAGFYERFLDQQTRQFDDIAIRPFEPGLAAAFRSLNRHWIEHHFRLEAADQQVLDAPEARIIDRGGQILFAVDAGSDQVLGTCALIRVDASRCELSKMAVAETAKGRQIGFRLGQAVLDLAASAGYGTVFLESNRKLAPAIALYRKLGFVEKSFPKTSDYERADIYMELDLAQRTAA